MATKKAGSSRKYSPGASKQVETEMKEMKRGTLKSGRSNRKVTNPKQAIAIGLSEARRAGKKVPPPPGTSASAKKATAKKSGAKKATKKAPTKKSAAKKSTAKKSSAKKKSAAK